MKKLLDISLVLLTITGTSLATRKESSPRRCPCRPEPVVETGQARRVAPLVQPVPLLVDPRLELFAIAVLASMKQERSAK